MESAADQTQTVKGLSHARDSGCHLQSINMHYDARATEEYANQKGVSTLDLSVGQE